MDAWPLNWRIGLLLVCALVWWWRRDRLGPGGIAFLVVLALGALVGEQHPVTRLPMYSVVETRDHLFVPAFQADGEDADPRDYERFVGLDRRPLDPPPIPISAAWYRDEMAAHIERHPGESAGPVVVTVGYRKLSIVDGDAVTGPVVVVSTGTAWRAE